MPELNNGWPDPARPGVPMNPDRDGWHWLKTPKGRFYSCWWNNIRWIETYPLGSSIDEVWRPAECAYAGPCLTPAEVEARVKQARRDAREEAARWHDEQAKRWQNTYVKESLSGLDMQATRILCLERGGLHIESAAAIRALGEKE